MLSRAIFAILILAVAASAQTVSSTVKGTVLDSSGAVVPAAACRLVNSSTGASVMVASAPDGAFQFLDVLPGKYTLTVTAPGLRRFDFTGLEILASEFHSAGNIVLRVGQATEILEVAETAAPIQLASGERSDTITGTQLNDIAVKGRDFVSYLATLTGVVDTNGSRDAMQRNALSGVHINGGRDTQTLLVVDGMPLIDAGNNGPPQEPNMDAIAEVRVLASNYQAEYGRNGGGAVTVISKTGTRSFHGSAYDYYRHESLNANSFFNNATLTPKAPYRYRMTGWTLGGPMLIPFHKDAVRNKVFFFFSQELIGSRVNNATRFQTTPSERERNGDFSQSYNVNGSLISVKDPLTKAQFPGNAERRPDRPEFRAAQLRAAAAQHSDLRSLQFLTMKNVLSILLLTAGLCAAQAQPQQAQPAPAARPPRPPAPTRDPHTPGYPPAKDLVDGTLPSPTEDGNFVLGPTHNPAPETVVKEGVPKGTVYEFTLESTDSKFYPGIAREAGTFGRPDPANPTKLIVSSHPAPYTRRVAVYVPKQYVPGTAAPFIVGADGIDRLLFTVLDNLIAEKRVPPMVAISIGNGGGDAQGSERGLEYDTMSGKYAEFVEAEVLPRAEKEANVKLTKDPDGRATMGGSSGGSAALIMAWYHPEWYHRVLTYSGTYVNQQWPANADTPHGAWEFHEHLIPNSPKKPLRLWLHVSDRDNLNTRDGYHDWVLANENMAKVLAAKGYHYQFVFARNAGHTDRAVKQQTLPEALEYVWQGYKAER
jgi:iron(III)-enterobactin esterase